MATLVGSPPTGGGWVHEIKFDGYRTLARIDAGAVRLITRNGLDWTRRYGAALVDAFTELPCGQAVIDGEVVVQDEHGRSSFVALQAALGRGETRQLLFYAFDLLYLDGYDLADTPLRERRRALEALLRGHMHERSSLQLSECFAGDGAAFFQRACALGLEGVVSKRVASVYRPVRSRDWLKAKCSATERFTVVGFTRSAASPVAALLLAERTPHGLRYAGRVNAALPQAARRDLRRRLEALRRRDPPLKTAPRGADVTWVAPRLFADVSYATRTDEGLLRHAILKDVTSDVQAEAPPPTRGRHVTAADLAAVSISNPDRVMFGGPTKLDLALYYARVGDWILPELLHRPVSLIRCPTGVEGDCFFQRHRAAGLPETIQTIRLREESARKPGEYLYIEHARGLLTLAQFGAVEFHPWGCRIDKPERPDRMTFDLDPGEGVAWADVVAAAFEIRAALSALGLVPYVKTTGGKGLHVVVPLRRRHDWSTVHRFAQAFAAMIAARAPQRFTDNLSKRSRKGRIFVDYLRNVRGATAVAAYSLRARSGAPVAMPVGWDELRTLDGPDAFTYVSAPGRLAKRKRDPWADMGRSARALTQAMASKVQAGQKA